jgi:DNA repair protein RadC
VDAVSFCRRRFARLAEDAKREEFWVVCLDTKLQVCSARAVSVGLLNQSLVGPREVFRLAIKENAAAVILVHNHPSGDPTPSREDLSVTERLEKVAQTIGIQMLDHVIVARHGCLSIQEYRQSQ